MKLNESNLADPLLLTGCGLGGTPWGSGSGPFGSQDLISTTTFPDESLIIPPSSNGGGGSSGGGGSLLCKGLPPGSSPTGQTGVELDALIMVQSSDGFAELKPLPPFDYGPASQQLALQNDPHLPQMGSSANSPPTHLTSTTGSNPPNTLRHGGSGGSTGSVSSMGSSPPGNSFGSPLAGSPSSLFDVVSSSTSVPANIKSELTEYLLNSDIDDIAALIGNAIADSTVPNLGIELDQNGVTSSTIDPWTELDAWIESACQQQASDVSSAGSHPSNTNGNSTNGGGGGNNSHGNGRMGDGLLDQDATIHTSADHHFLAGNTASTLQSILAAGVASGLPGTNSNNHPPGHPPPMYGQQDLKHSDFQSTSILQARLQAPPASGGPLRVTTSNNGSGTSPNQLPESTTAHFGLKVEPYTLDPGSPPFIDPITGEVAQRPHTTHVSPPAVVTSTMMGPGSGSGRYRKSYKLSNKSSENQNGNLPSGYGVVVADTNSFLFGNGTAPTTTSPFDPTNPGLTDQVSYDNFVEACKGQVGGKKNRSPSLGHGEKGDHEISDQNIVGSYSNSSNTVWWRMVDNNVYTSTTSGKLGLKTKRKSSKLPSSTGLDPLDPCGKEKPIHRCTVCNRGFLNKSNIKVHLRTHTGEKPFKCDVCGKAFRQKAHLLKHIQIHKRIPRD